MAFFPSKKGANSALPNPLKGHFEAEKRREKGIKGGRKGIKRDGRTIFSRNKFLVTNNY